MTFEHTWRWYGPNDPISLAEIRQTGATGIVTALHHIPNGEVWSIEEIQKRKSEIEAAGLQWSVVESVPVHEDIKKQKDNFKIYIQNYKQTLRNLGQNGINTVCYNFMPVLDWSRTNLYYELKDGKKALIFKHDEFAAFDMYILKRPGAAKDYPESLVDKAKMFFENASAEKKQELSDTVLKGLPGSEESFKLNEFQQIINEYKDIDTQKLKSHLFYFLKEIIPVAEESGVRMAIHPDDPPWSIFGLPRIIKNRADIQRLLSIVDDPANGLALCSGSFGADPDNSIPAIIREFGNRIHFAHIRNIEHLGPKTFHETAHPTNEGSLDIYEIVKAYSDIGYTGPMRPDHGRMIWEEKGKPGYGLFDRALGLMYLNGLWEGINKSLK